MNNKCIDANQKTYRSFDLTTICPKKKANNPCPYCYVEASRKIGFNAKALFDRRVYSGEVCRMRQVTIDKLNRMGGIRMFSFGDYEPWMDMDITRFLHDCENRKLDVKAITKQPEFIQRFHHSPALKVINVSTDFIGHGVPWKIAIQLRCSYDKVRIRSVITSPIEPIQATIYNIDVLTFNHGHNGYHNFKKEDIQKMSKYTSMKGKICCLTSKCETCETKCGYKPDK